MSILNPHFVNSIDHFPMVNKIALIDSLDQNSPISIRWNPLKTNNRIDSSISWCNTGQILSERPIFTLDPRFHGGAYYVQEASSMFLEKILEQFIGENPQGLCVLDLCASPGGKSTHLSQWLGEKNLLVSNEVIGERARVLDENLTKWGKYNTIVTQSDPSKFSSLGPLFDVILVDAPCSGEGMFRKDPGAREEWNPGLIEFCAIRQQRILQDAWSCLRPGGILIYSTCTFNTLENEQNVQWASIELGSQIQHINTDEFPEIVNTKLGIRFYPDRVAGEGLFYSVMRKEEDSNKSKPFNRKKNTELKTVKKVNGIDFLTVEDFILLQYRDRFMVIDSQFTEVAQLLSGVLYIVSCGLDIGEYAFTSNWRPSQALANCNYLRKDHFQKLALEKEQALRFLSLDTFDVSSQNGFNLITYNELPLGWIKVIKNRFNNYYPKNWRIRMNIENKGAANHQFG